MAPMTSKRKHAKHAAPRACMRRPATGGSRCQARKPVSGGSSSATKDTGATSRTSLYAFGVRLRCAGATSRTTTYMHNYIHEDMHLHTKRTHASIHTYIHTFTYIPIYIHIMHVHAYRYTANYIHKNKQTCKHIDMPTYMHIHIACARGMAGRAVECDTWYLHAHMHIHTHIHTHTYIHCDIHAYTYIHRYLRARTYIHT